jgi:hypothetical protein
MKSAVHLLAAAAFFAAVPARADTPPATLTEGFNDIASLTGWATLNASVPPGQDWFQGNPGVFGAQAGASESYIAANFNATSSPSGMVDLWLITSVLHVDGVSDISFWTRSADGAGFTDALEVRFSPTGGADPASFTSVVQALMPVPQQWTQYQPGVFAANADGRFAFHYVGNASSLNYIGIDSVQVMPVPEPASYAMLGLGLAVLLARRHRRTVAACAALAIGSGALAADPPQPGAVVVRDPVTGQLRAPNASEFRALKALEASMAPPAPPPAVTTRRADGTLQRHLGEAGMSYAVISRGADGKLAVECVDGAKQAQDKLQKEDSHEDR